MELPFVWMKVEKPLHGEFDQSVWSEEVLGLFNAPIGPVEDPR